MRKGIEIAFKSVEYRSSLRSNEKKNLSRQSNNLIGLGIAKVRTFLMSRMTTSLTIKRDVMLVVHGKPPLVTHSLTRIAGIL